LKRFFITAFGLFLCGTGSYITIQANVGLAPWDALHIGLTKITGLIYGDVSIIISIFIIAIDLLMKEKIGFGTLMNAFMYPKWIDLWNYVKLIPEQKDMLHGMPVLFCGMVLIAVGSLVYMSGAMGCGPRDTFFVGIGRRFPKTPIGVVKGGVEVVVALIGAMFGAKIGIGTLASLFLQSFILQMVFNIAHFEARAVKHENFADTINIMRNAKKSSV